MKKKRLFTLIEIMVTLSLFAIMVSTLFYWTHRHFSQRKQWDQLQGTLIEDRYFEKRVNNLLSKVSLEGTMEEKLQFSSDGQSLHFTFDNGPYIHPLLSNKVRCCLEKKEDLLLCTLAPLCNKGNLPKITYPLLDHVDRLSFSFYQPSTPTELTVRPSEVSPDCPQPGHHKSWKETYHSLPAYVRIEIEKEGNIKEFLFDLHYPLHFKEAI